MVLLVSNNGGNDFLIDKPNFFISNNLGNWQWYWGSILQTGMHKAIHCINFKTSKCKYAKLKLIEINIITILYLHYE